MKAGGAQAQGTLRSETAGVLQSPAVWVWVALALILLASLAFNLYGNGFALGYHFDEPRKVRFIQDHTQNFFHPILMLQVCRIVSAFAGAGDAQSVVEMGRTVTALFATLSVLASFLLFRRVAGTRVALWTAAAVAVMPILVVHAHYLKEDLYLVPFLMLSLHAFLRYRERGDSASLIWWGVTTGLALSSKYIAVQLLLNYWLVQRAVQPDPGRGGKHALGQMTLIAAGTFCVVNYPMFLEPWGFLSGFSSEATRSVKGAVIRVWPWEQFFTFHIRRSLAPGMTWLWVGLAGLGIASVARPLRRMHPTDLLLLSYVALWLGTAELTPKKPFPDAMRYVIPIVPVVAFYAVRGIDAVLARIQPGRNALRWLVPLLALAWPTYESVRLVDQLQRDTRDRVAEVIPRGARVLHERYASRSEDVRFVTDLTVAQLREQKIDYVVVSGFNWERMYLGASMSHQKRDVYRHAARYRALFATCPYQTVFPTYEAYAFSNPELRVVRLGPCLGKLTYPR